MGARRDIRALNPAWSHYWVDSKLAAFVSAPRSNAIPRRTPALCSPLPLCHRRSTITRLAVPVVVLSEFRFLLN